MNINFVAKAHYEMSYQYKDLPCTIYMFTAERKHGLEYEFAAEPADGSFTIMSMFEIPADGVTPLEAMGIALANADDYISGFLEYEWSDNQ